MSTSFTDLRDAISTLQAIRGDRLKASSPLFGSTVNNLTPDMLEKMIIRLLVLLGRSNRSLADIGASDSELEKYIRHSQKEFAERCVGTISVEMSFLTRKADGINKLKETLALGDLTLDDLELNPRDRRLVEFLLQEY